jgi:hypothetical protein
MFFVITSVWLEKEKCSITSAVGFEALTAATMKSLSSMI